MSPTCQRDLIAIVCRQRCLSRGGAGNAALSSVGRAVDAEKAHDDDDWSGTRHRRYIARMVNGELRDGPDHASAVAYSSPPMFRRTLGILPLVLVMASVIVAFFLGGYLSELVLSFAPVALMIGLLRAGGYIGAKRLTELVARVRGKRARIRPVRTWSSGISRCGVRGGRLIAHSLAERGPPALLAARG